MTATTFTPYTARLILSDTRPYGTICREIHRVAAGLMDCDVCAASSISKIEKLAETLYVRDGDPLAEAVIALCNTKHSPIDQMNMIAAVTAPFRATAAA